MMSKIGATSGLERTVKILMLTFSMILQLSRNIFNMKDRCLFPKEVTEQLVEIPLYGGEIYLLSLLLKLCFCFGAQACQVCSDCAQMLCAGSSVFADPSSPASSL